VMVLGVDQGESVSLVSEYVRQNVGVTFPLLMDRSQDVGDRYLVRSLPTTFFIDADGIIREIRVGGPMEVDFLNEKVRALGR
jgi:cytochrome c biogenesis protein CcmG/thiol:disulfide interchange protein DsbE